jgi:hypothetical protein
MLDVKNSSQKRLLFHKINHKNTAKEFLILILASTSFSFAAARTNQRSFQFIFIISKLEGGKIQTMKIIKLAR